MIKIGKDCRQFLYVACSVTAYVTSFIAVMLFPRLKLSRRKAFSDMLRRVSLVRPGVSEEQSTAFIKVTRIGELVTTVALALGIPSQRSSVVSYS
jgi:hypothetical protein